MGRRAGYDWRKAGGIVLKSFWFFVLWFMVASVADGVIRKLSESPDYWILRGLAFNVVLNIGAYIGRHYSGWWIPGSSL